MKEPERSWIVPSFHRSPPRILAMKRQASSYAAGGIFQAHVRETDSCGVHRRGPRWPSRVEADGHRVRSRSLPGIVQDDSSISTDEEPFSLLHMSRSEKYTLICLAVVDLFMYLCMSIMAPFFPEKVEQVGASETVSGLVFAVYALSVFISSPIFARLLPLFGAKRTFMGGILVAGCCNILFGLLDYVNDGVTFTALAFSLRIIEGSGAGAFSTASYAILADVFAHNVPLVFGTLEAFVGIGMTVGPAIGGLLYAVGGFGAPFYVVGSLMVLTVPLTFWLLPVHTNLPLDGTEAISSRSRKKFFKNPRVYIVVLTIFVTASVWAFLDPTLQPQLITFDLSAAKIGLLFLLLSATYAVFSPLWGWIMSRVENSGGPMMVMGLVLSGVTLLFLGPAPFLLPYTGQLLWLNILCLALLGVSISLSLIPTFESIRLATEEAGMDESINTYALVSGVWASAYAFGEVVGPALGGYLDDLFQFSVCSAIFAALCLIAAVILGVYLIIHGLRRRHREHVSHRTETSRLAAKPGVRYGALKTAELDDQETDPCVTTDMLFDDTSSVSAAATV